MFLKSMVVFLASAFITGAAWAVPPEIHVTWDESPPPVEDLNFSIDDSDPDFPSVELIDESLTWRIWSTDEDNPQHVGDIGVINSPHPENFGVKIVGDNNTPGARTVKSINLDPQGSGSDDNYSSITSGELLGALQENLFLQKSSSGAGGELTLEIGGAVSGDVTIPKVVSMTVGGNVSGDLSVETIPAGGELRVEGSVTGTGQIAVGEMVDNVDENKAGFVIEGDLAGDATFGRIGDGADFEILGDLLGDVTMNGDLDRGNISVVGDVASSATITIQHIGDYAHIQLAENGEVAGRLIFQQGIPEAGNMVQISGPVVAGATIDLTNDDALGSLQLFAGGAGSIINGAVVKSSGLVVLGSEDTTVFSGSASFSSVEFSGGGTSGSIYLSVGADLAGSISIAGDAADTINVTGDVLSGAAISIGGVPVGDVSVGESCNSSIEVGDDILGAISVAKKLEQRGSILCDGLCTGSIIVGEDTDTLSLIHVVEGIGSGGSITINDSAGAFDADGLIYIGTTTTTPPLDPVTFDGSILIKKPESGSGGALNGAIKVVGCHATDDDLDICRCGGNNGTVSIIQNNCTNQVGWDCLSGCP